MRRLVVIFLAGALVGYACSPVYPFRCAVAFEGARSVITSCRFA